MGYADGQDGRYSAGHNAHLGLVQVIEIGKWKGDLQSSTILDRLRERHDLLPISILIHDAS